MLEGVGREAVASLKAWIPAFAGMTEVVEV